MAEEKEAWLGKELESQVLWYCEEAAIKPTVSTRFASDKEPLRVV